MRNLILLLLIVFSTQVFGQIGFVERVTGTNIFNSPYDVVLMPNNNTLFLNKSMSYTSQITANELYEVSPEGEILKTAVLIDSTSNYVTLTHAFIIEDTLFVLGWGEKNTTKSQEYLLLKTFDLLLNPINSYEIIIDHPLFVDNINTGEIKFIDNHFFYLSSSGALYTALPFLAEISRQGELIRLDFDNTTGYDRLPYDFIKKPNNRGFQVYTFINGLSGHDQGGYILNYDKALNLQNFIQMPYHFFWGFTCMPIDTSNFYLSGQWVDQSSNGGWHAGILKMNSESTVLDEFLYTTYPDSTACPAYRNSIDALPDGNLIFSFTDNIGVQLIPQLNPTYINLIKLTPDLDMIWHRYIGYPDAKNEAFVMRTAPDGGIVIFAAWSPAPPIDWHYTEPMFIKTDSEGLITGISEELQGIRSSEAILYPNPAKDFVHIEYSLAYSAATFSLADINGKTVLEKQLTSHLESVDISALSAGTYVYRIFNKKGLDERGKIMVE